MEYRWYELSCANHLYVPYQWKNARVSELRPYDWTGGGRRVNSTAYGCPNTAYRQSVPASSSSYVSKTTTYARSNSISYGGFSLNASQKNTGSHKKTYTNTSTTVSATLCGENGQPAVTDKVSEV
jgi:hypothetical protein